VNHRSTSLLNSGTDEPVVEEQSQSLDEIRPDETFINLVVIYFTISENGFSYNEDSKSGVTGGWFRWQHTLIMFRP
jgi:hypothetical protein